ncbi:MAG: hypothetical protein NTW74_02175 [Acidobacteria bacterium]|nr:hypothetical protein [Acidobacteriota bacterium]
MVLMLVWFLVFAGVLGAADLETKLQEYRQLPALIQSRVMLGLIREFDLKDEAARAVAREAYEVASRVDRSVEGKEFPVALAWAGGPEDALVEAWQVYRVGEFPVRARSSVARCEHRVVDDPSRYLKVAMEVGEFEAAASTLRSAVEIEAGLELVLNWKDERAVVVGRQLVQRLRRATQSRREFEKAKGIAGVVRSFAARVPDEMRDEVLGDFEYFKTQNEQLPSCGAGKVEEEEDFVELKRKLLRIEGGAEQDYFYVETFLKLFRLAQSDAALLDELEAAGNERLRLLVRAFRARGK